MMDKIFVVKKSGEKEPFSEEKILRSMERVGVPLELHPIALEKIKENLRDGITTEEIFSTILDFLKNKDRKLSMKFSLKQAIFEMGPTGYPFEKYMERIFKSIGYKTEVEVTLMGNCVKHEVDLILETDSKKEIVEAKFHNMQGVKTDIQVVLYTYSRFLDLKDKNKLTNVWVVTNTKLTEDALSYGECKSIKMIAWNYPAEKSLQSFIEDPKMYPITVLNSLTSEEKQRLMEKDIILCSELLNLTEVDIKDLQIDKNRFNQAKEDVDLFIF